MVREKRGEGPGEGFLPRGDHITFARRCHRLEEFILPYSFERLGESMYRKYIVGLIVCAFLGSVIVLMPGGRATDVPGGHISTNTTWTLAGSPYNVLGTIYIDSGVKLSVEPGVVVNASAGITIYVDGMLNVSGTAGQNVEFSSTGPWSGIQVNSTSPWTRILYATIDDATGGISATRTNLTLSHVDANGCAVCVSIANTTFKGDNLTITALGDGIVSTSSVVDLRDSVVMGGNGADGNATLDGARGGHAMNLAHTGESSFAKGNSTLINVTLYGGDGGGATNTSRVAGKGGAAIYMTAGKYVRIENSYLYGGKGGTASLLSAGAGEGGAGISLHGATQLWARSSMYGGRGGDSLASGSDAGAGGMGVDVAGSVASTHITFTGSNIYGGAGGDANASSSKGGNGGIAVSLNSPGATEFELFSMKIVGGKGGAAKKDGAVPGDGGDGIWALNIYRSFAYSNVWSGGAGGDVLTPAKSRGGTGGIGLYLLYVEQMYDEMGLFSGGKGGDDRSTGGKGGGTGGAGVVEAGGKAWAETGETDIHGGDGGDVYVNASAPGGNGPDYATKFTGAPNIYVFESSSVNSGKGGKNLAGGPNGKAGNITYIGTPMQRLVVNGFYGVQGETDHCVMINNTTTWTAGNVYSYCKNGLVVKSPSGGVTSGVDSRYDMFWKNEVGILLKNGSNSTFTNAIVKDNTFEGAKAVEGSISTWKNAVFSNTPVAVHADGGSSMMFTGSKINSTKDDIVAENASHVTTLSSTFKDSKAKVKDTSVVTVQNLMDLTVVDKRWTKVCRPDVRLYDNGAFAYDIPVDRGGDAWNIVLTDRTINSTGVLQNVTSATVMFRNWTFTGYPDPIDNIDLSYHHMEWFVGDGTAPPKVNYSIPRYAWEGEKNAVGVPAGSRVTISFTVPMNETAVEESLTITGGLVAKDIKWSADGKTMDFFPSPWLMPDTDYIFTWNGSVAKDTLGLLLDGSFNGVATGHPEDDFVLEFTTGPATNVTILGNDTAPLSVDQGQTLVPMLVTDLVGDENQLLAKSIVINKTGTAPDSEVESVSLWLDTNGNARWDLADRAIAYKNFTAGSATFDLGMTISQLKLEHLFTVINVTKSALVGHTIGVMVASEQSLDVLGATVKMPVKPLASHNATVGGDVTPPNVTGASPKGTGISLNTDIVVTFDEPMNWTSVQASFSTLPPLQFDFTVSGDSAVFKPKTPYQYGTTYKVTLLGSVAKDTSSNLLDGNNNGISEGSPIDDATWTFATISVPAGELSGSVSDDIGSPVQNVTISVGTQKTGKTDANGLYSIQPIPTGKYDITYTCPGYLDLKITGVDIATGATTWRNVTVKLLAGSVQGFVRDSSGAGIQGVSVEIKNITGKLATTDASGAYSLSRVPTGTYTVTASKSGYKSVMDQVVIKNGQATSLNLTLEKTATEEPVTSPYLYVAIALGALLLLVVLYFLFAGKKKPPAIDEDEEEPEEEGQEKEEDKEKEEEDDDEKGKDKEDKKDKGKDDKEEDEDEEK